jgi:hypothetical protein
VLSLDYFDAEEAEERYLGRSAAYPSKSAAAELTEEQNGCLRRQDSFDLVLRKPVFQMVDRGCERPLRNKPSDCKGP